LTDGGGHDKGIAGHFGGAHATLVLVVGVRMTWPFVTHASNE
jgi:hypothetical protein